MSVPQIVVRLTLMNGIARSGFRNRLLLQWELFGVAKHDSLHCATSQLLSIVFFEFEKWHFSFVEQNAYMCKTVAKLRNSCRLSAGREGYGAFGGAALRHLTQPIRYFVIGLSPVRVYLVRTGDGLNESYETGSWRICYRNRRL